MYQTIPECYNLIISGRLEDTYVFKGKKLKPDISFVRGILHWKKFVSLFQGLTNDTKIKEIMEIRGRKLPKPTKYNQEEIQNLRELKAYYAIGDLEENYQDGLGELFNSLERMASK